MSLAVGVLIATASTGLAFAPLNPIARRIVSATRYVQVTPSADKDDSGGKPSEATQPPRPLSKLSIRAMKVELQRFGVDHRDLFERADLERRLTEARSATRSSLQPDANNSDRDGQSTKSDSGSGSRFKQQDKATTKEKNNVSPDKGLVNSWWRQLGADELVDRFVKIDEERPWEWAEQLAPSDAAALDETNRIAYEASAQRDNETHLENFINVTTAKLRDAAEVAGDFMKEDSTESKNERSPLEKVAYWTQNNNSKPTAKSTPTSKVDSSASPTKRLSRNPSPQPAPRLSSIPDGGYDEVRQWATTLGQSSSNGAATLVEILASRGLKAEAAESQNIEAQAALLASDVASARALVAKRSDDQADPDAVSGTETTRVEVPHQIDTSDFTERIQASDKKQQQKFKVQKAHKSGAKGTADVSVLEALLEAERWWARALPRHKLETELVKLLSGRPRLAALLLDAPSLADESSSTPSFGKFGKDTVVAPSGASAAEMVAAVAAKDESSSTAPVVAVALAGMTEAMAKLDDAALAEVVARASLADQRQKAAETITAARKGRLGGVRVESERTGPLQGAQEVEIIVKTANQSRDKSEDVPSKPMAASDEEEKEESSSSVEAVVSKALASFEERTSGLMSACRRALGLPKWSRRDAEAAMKAAARASAQSSPAKHAWGLVQRAAASAVGLGLALGKWAGGPALVPEHALLLAVTAALATRSGLGGLIVSLVAIRLARMYFSEDNDAPDLRSKPAQ